ncbi:type II secretion system protein GspM [Pseudoxanthomonas suwonensis]|uniref:type II secretion system protein GspM n=2 Tax=Lysobacteraceae TaxID=32033 RepID=UPI0004BA9237|nr:type II secretion system protein GspM [Pseudoxanthomonas suwonensis]
MALALLLAVLAAAYALIVHPAWTGPMREADQRIRDLQERDQRIQAQLRQAAQVERQLQEVAGALAGRPGFLPERSAELASAGLAQRLETAVLAASPDGRTCAIHNRSPLPAETEEGRFIRVSLRAHLRCGVPALAAVLHALESGQPRLFVDKVSLLAQRTADGRDNSGGVEASFDLSGYLDQEGATGVPVEVGDAP